MGKGVPLDYVEAARLWRLAYSGGIDAARDGLAALAGQPEYVAGCCMGCGATRKLKTCARCRVARFCGAECVRSAWAAHKPHCTCWARAAGMA